MTIASYSDLQTAVGNWLDRSDLSSRIPEFITLFEDEANMALRVRQQVTSTTLSTSSGDATIPSDYLEWIRVTRQTNPVQDMQYTIPAFLQQVYPSVTQINMPPIYSAQKAIFTIEGSTFKCRPIDDSTSITFVYYQKIPALSGSNDTTQWLFVAHPVVYLAGALAEAHLFAENTNMAQAWLARRDDQFAKITMLNRFTKGQAQAMPMGPTP